MTSQKPEMGETLAVGRTILAMDRTLMAWVRTSLSLISFGFTIYKFLDTLASRNAVFTLKPTAPRNIGLFLTTVGTISLGMALLQFWHAMERRLGVSRRDLLLNPTVWLASAIWIFGLILLIGIFAKVM
jgi:putative membrane protein